MATMQRTRRVHLRAAGAGVSAALLAACGVGSFGSRPSKDAVGANGSKVTLTAYFGVAPDQAPRFDADIAQVYAKQQPNVEVQLLPQPSGGESEMR